MNQPNNSPNIAVFADYENVAIGAREAGLEPFRIDLALARLLDKGKIILKKAYSDWSRYRGAKKIRRKRPQFDERSHGYRSFNDLVRDAQDKSLVEARMDEQSGGFVVLAAS